MNTAEIFAGRLRERLCSHICKVKAGYPPLEWLDGDLVLVLVQQKRIEIREEIFKLMRENPGKGMHSLAPLVYSSFEFRENLSMKSSFAAWLEAEGEEY